MYAAIKQKFNAYPPEAWLEQAGKALPYSPDAHLLENKQCVFLFVCDEMQQKNRRFDLITTDQYEERSSVYLAPAFTQPQFSFFKKELGKESYPVAFTDVLSAPAPGTTTSKKLHQIKGSQTVEIVPKAIRGELYAVRPYKLFELDKYKENGVVFQRRLVPVIMPYLYRKYNAYATSELQYRCQTFDAWMYIGIYNYWKDYLDGGFQFSQVPTVDNNPIVSGYCVHDYVSYPYYHYDFNSKTPEFKGGPAIVGKATEPTEAVELTKNDVKTDKK